MIGRIVVSLILAITLVMALLANPVVVAPARGQFGGVPTAASTRAANNWEMTNHDTWGSNHNPQTQINAGNARDLQLAWVFPTPSSNAVGSDGLVGFDANEGTIAPPLIVDGIAYMAMNYQTIFAIDMRDGSTIWTRTAEYDANAANLCGVQGDFILGNKGLNPTECLPIWSAAAHTHAMYYQELNGRGVLWLNSFGCTVKGIDAETGEDIYELAEFCRGVPTNSGLYNGQGSHPPVIHRASNSLILYIGGHMEGSLGGRSFVASYDLDTKALNWRFFYQPPNGELFPDEYRAWGDMLVATCDRGYIAGIPACDVSPDLLRNDWGGMPFNAGVSNIWGQAVIDEEEDMLFFGTAQPGPDFNHTGMPGPRLFGSAIIALKASTGELMWYYQDTTKDLWDYDCAWNTILGELDGEKVVFKQCKSGRIHAFNALTGEVIWIRELTSQTFSEFVCNAACDNWRPNGLGVIHSRALGIDGLGDNNNWTWLDPRNEADMNKNWQNEHMPGKGIGVAILQNPAGSGGIEADMSFDGVNVYVMTKNDPGYFIINAIDRRTAQFAGPMGFITSADADFDIPRNHTITAIDARTGEEKWVHFVPDVPSRGGVITTGGPAGDGGIVFWNNFGGDVRVLDAETGQVLKEIKTGTGLDVQPAVGADKDGKMYVLQTFGGRGLASAQGRGQVPGAMLAFTLADVVPREDPAAQEEIQRLEGQLDDARMELEDARAAADVAAVAISPISYVIIGVGVVLVVVAGVLFARRRST